MTSVAATERPKRNSAKRNVELVLSTIGMSHREETELRRALQDSMKMAKMESQRTLTNSCDSSSTMTPATTAATTTTSASLSSSSSSSLSSSLSSERRGATSTSSIAIAASDSGESSISETQIKYNSRPKRSSRGKRTQVLEIIPPEEERAIRQAILMSMQDSTSKPESICSDDHNCLAQRKGGDGGEADCTAAAAAFKQTTESQHVAKVNHHNCAAAHGNKDGVTLTTTATTGGGGRNGTTVVNNRNHQNHSSVVLANKRKQRYRKQFTLQNITTPMDLNSACAKNVVPIVSTPLFINYLCKYGSPTMFPGSNVFFDNVNVSTPLQPN